VAKSINTAKNDSNTLFIFFSFQEYKSITPFTYIDEYYTVMVAFFSTSA